MANWSLEIPELTGDAELDSLELYGWAIQANEQLKRLFSGLGTEYSEIYEKYTGLLARCEELESKLLGMNNGG